MTDQPDRRGQILAAAAEMFARKGIRSTTVREIGDSVGILSGSLYHYFASKDDMVEEIMVSFLDAIRARYTAVLARGLGPAESLREFVLTSLQLAREQPDATALYQNELRYLREEPRFKKVLASASEVQNAWLAIIEQGVADGSFRADIAPRVFHRLIRDAVWLSGRGQHGPSASSASSASSTEELADAITTIFLDGFAARF
jgi:TetR/AcrR family transcriptional regulator, cholesterol catabolism regulator